MLPRLSAFAGYGNHGRSHSHSGHGHSQSRKTAATSQQQSQQQQGQLSGQSGRSITPTRLSHRHQQAHSISARSSMSVDGNGSRRSSRGQSISPEGGKDETVVEPEQGNILMHIISQLRPGADLSRVVLPTFILEPRSMLERITNFMAHPEMLLPIPDIEDPVERFVSVVKFYLSGWHIKPPGVKKPLNPILGETFTGYWTYPDGTHGYYIAEQTSHHPPKSSYFFMAPEHHIRVDGTLKPHGKFLGNSAGSMMEGIAVLSLLNHGEKGKGEKYLLTQPNMYARGILIGKMKFELGDHSYVRCPENHLVADIEFKTKGWFSGGYNAIGGTIKDEKSGEVYYEISGHWTGEMFIKNHKTGKKEMFFDAESSKHTPPTTRPIEEQDPRESQRLWKPVVDALNARNQDVATDEKTKIEERQREEKAKREQDGHDWKPKLFRPVDSNDEDAEDLDWIIAADVDGEDPAKACEQILSIAPIMRGEDQQGRGQGEGEEQASESKEAEPKEAESKEATEDSPKKSQQQQTSQESRGRTQYQQPPPQKHSKQAQEGHNSLIDLGSGDENEAPAPLSSEKFDVNTTKHSPQGKGNAAGVDLLGDGVMQSGGGGGGGQAQHNTSSTPKDKESRHKLFPSMKDLMEPLKPEKHLHGK